MNKENRITLIAILIAYIFAFIFHLYWLHWAVNIPEFFWHSQVMINNVDGYYFASGAQKILYHEHLFNHRLLNVYNMGLSVITAYIVKFLPFLSLNTVILYLSAIIGSLVVIPIILIGKLYKNLKWGFLAALIGGIVWSYYNRTLVGYYDTDMFSVVIPLFLVYFILKSFKTNFLKDVIIGIIFILFYNWVYSNGNVILYAILIFSFLYLLIFSFKEKFTYEFIFLFSLSLVGINPFFKITLICLGYLFLTNKKLPLKQLQLIAGIAFLLFFGTSDVFSAILHKILSYYTNFQDLEGLQFLNVNRTIMEASHIPWFIVFDRIIGSTLGIIIAIIGYIMLLKKYKEFIITLPLWGVGFFAFAGGLRFTEHAVLIAAISAVYFFVWISDKIKNNALKYLTIIGGSFFILIPNITHIVGCCENNKLLASFEKIYPLKSYPYIVPTTFNKNEVEVLNQLKSISNPQDYVVTWWDYGYPIWYYANVNTLVDGGKHNQDDFIVSKILTTSNQRLAANLAKLAIKTYAKTGKSVASQLFIKNKKPINVNNYLSNLGKQQDNIKLNRDVYLMLPFRMFNILPTISMFSNRDINTGKVYHRHFFYKGRIKQEGRYLIIGRVVVDLQKGVMLFGKHNIVPIKEANLVSYNKQGKLVVQTDYVHPEGLNLIVLKNYQQAFILDDYYYNSTFVQMFVFQHYDKKLFQPVILNPIMKIYKIK